MAIITLQNTSFFSAVLRGAMFVMPLSATYWPHLRAAHTSLCRVHNIQVHPQQNKPSVMPLPTVGCVWSLPYIWQALQRCI